MRPLRRIGRAAATFPTLRGWIACAGLSLATAAAILLVGLATGLLAWAPSPASWTRLLIGALPVPALAEEVVFRGLLTPSRSEEPRPVPALLPGLAAFVLWHIAAGLLLPGARLFLRPDFLLCAAILGLACGAMRWRTGSLWPGVLTHAAAVWTWQALLGGIAPADLI